MRYLIPFLLIGASWSIGCGGEEDEAEAGEEAEGEGDEGEEDPNLCGTPGAPTECPDSPPEGGEACALPDGVDCTYSKDDGSFVGYSCAKSCIWNLGQPNFCSMPDLPTDCPGETPVEGTPCGLAEFEQCTYTTDDCMRGYECDDLCSWFFAFLGPPEACGDGFPDCFGKGCGEEYVCTDCECKLGNWLCIAPGDECPESC